MIKQCWHLGSYQPLNSTSMPLQTNISFCENNSGAILGKTQELHRFQHYIKGIQRTANLKTISQHDANEAI